MYPLKPTASLATITPLPPLPDAVTSVIAKSSWSVYPNPAHSLLYITTSGPAYAGTSITMYNTLGQLISTTQTNNTNLTTIDISALTAGVYYLLCKSGNQVQNVKFIKD